MGAYDTPTQKCPYCGDEAEADFVDVGVGMVQCGPYHCYSCGSSEIGPEYDDWCYKDRKGAVIRLKGKRVYSDWIKKKVQFNVHSVLRIGHPFTEKEIETHWYEPRQNKVSPYSNTVGGVLVDHQTAKQAYNMGLLDEKKLNPNNLNTTGGKI